MQIDTETMIGALITVGGGGAAVGFVLWAFRLVSPWWILGLGIGLPLAVVVVFLIGLLFFYALGGKQE